MLSKNFEKISSLATYTHSVANFMPCPKGFNIPKNSAKITQDGKVLCAFDFLPLMIDLIEKCYVMGEEEYNKSRLEYTTKDNVESVVRIEYSTIEEWHNYFAGTKEEYGDVRTNYCLEDYYDICDDPNDVEKKHIKGIRLFDRQSLEYPVPREKEEIEQCLNEMIRRIENRAENLASKNSQGTQE